MPATIDKKAPTQATQQRFCRWVMGKEWTLAALESGNTSALEISVTHKSGAVATEIYHVTRIEGGWSMGYMVPGEDDEGVQQVIYEVPDGFLSCTCPDHQYRHRACKHAQALRAALKALGL